jgi:hypothetical protein
LAKLLDLHAPRLTEDELQALKEFCDYPGDRDVWRRRWEEFAAGIHDNCWLARSVYSTRVVAKAQIDAEVAELHDLFRWFWLFTTPGRRRLKEPHFEIADTVRERTSIAVKAALKSVLEAPLANSHGGRRRGRRKARAALEGGESDASAP